MTRQQVRHVVRRLLELLKSNEQPFSAERADPAERLLNNYDRLCHIRWMCEELLKDASLNKATRWIGFAQGALWGMGLVTLDEMTALNAPNEGEEDL